MYLLENQSYTERKERGREREISHLLVHFPSGHHDQDWDGLKPGDMGAS